MSKLREVPMFSRQRVNFSPNYALTHLTVSNNKLVLAMTNKVLLRITLSNPGSPTEIDLKEFGIEGKLLNIFLDPSGSHLLLSLSPADSETPAKLLYIPPPDSSQKPKEVVGLSSHIVTAVSWAPYAIYTDSKIGPKNTLPFLLGTSKGLVFEGEIINSELKVSKQLYELSKTNTSSPRDFFITDIQFFPSIFNNTISLTVLISTPRKLIELKGTIGKYEERPWFSSLFSHYVSQSRVEEVLEVEESGAEISWSRLNLNLDEKGGVKGIAYVGSKQHILFCNMASDGESKKTILSSLTKIPYPHLNSNTSLATKDENYSTSSSTSDKFSNYNSNYGHIGPSCKGILTTNFHALLLYSESIIGISTLNHSTVFTHPFETDKSGSKVLNLCRDPANGTIWYFTERSVHKYIVKGEERNNWRIFLDKLDFKKALQAANGDEEKNQTIYTREAELYFEKKEYEKSAMYYALTKCTFEEIALKFLQIDDSTALKIFLLKKLSIVDGVESSKISILVLWLIEIYLSELGALRDFGKKGSDEYRNLEEEFLKFMGEKRVKECVKENKKCVYELMGSHGDRENLVHFTLVMKDFEEVIENNIASAHFHAALSTLEKQKDGKLYSRFIPVLLDKIPSETIDVLIRAGPMLSPTKLLPKFSSKLNPQTAHEITRYIEHCVSSLKLTEQSIHDYLLSLYIHYYPEDKLMNYLTSQGTDINRLRYDPKYGLSMCLEKELKKATVFLYTIMGLYEEAIELALSFDLELAKKTADETESDEELRKKLWLKIARHVVHEKNDIGQAMEFLNDCELLRIEDILPFFPNFVTIDQFKSALCSSLSAYNTHLEQLKEEMEEATRSGEVLRGEIGGVRKRCALIGPSHRCTICGGGILVISFHIFPCGHLFHTKCLAEEVAAVISPQRRQRLFELQRKLVELNYRGETESVNSSAGATKDEIKSDISDIIAPDCFYCGEHMIKLIDTPFISPEDFDRVQKEWE